MDEPQWLGKCLNISTPLEEVINEIKTNLSPNERVEEVDEGYYSEPGFSQCGYKEHEMIFVSTGTTRIEHTDRVPDAGRYLSRIIEANHLRRKELLEGLKGHSVYYEVPLLDRLRCLL